MRSLLFLGLLISTQLFAQSLSYTPGQTVSKTINKSYYSTDYLHFTYHGSDLVDLSFELIKDTAHQDWHRALCTNLICYNDIPEYGQLGTFSDGDQGYLSISLSTGNHIGSGIFKFRVYSDSKSEIDDTLTFNYEIIDSEAIINQPWVKIDFKQNVVFALFKNAQLKSSMEIFDLSGNLIHQQDIAGSYSYSMAAMRPGVYIVRIISEAGQEEVKRIVKV